MELWKKYITWERSNPLRSEDTALVARRVMFAIEQGLLCLAHHPDVWHQAAQFLDHSAKLLQEKGVSTPLQGGGGYQGQTALRGGPAFSPGEVCVHEDYSELPSSCSFI